MTQDEVEQLLYGAAVSQALSFGYRLGPGADTDLQAHARGAATKIFQTGRTGEDQEVDIEHAVRAFRFVVDTMIGVRREAYRQRPADLQGNVIGEDTLRLAKLKLCPGLWPFC